MVSIFVIGFPKSGTTTLQTAFGRAGLTSAHWRVPGGFCGELIYEDFYAGRDPLERFPEFDCIAQPDVCRPDQRKNGAELNYWPQLDFDVIQAIERFNPDMRFLLNKRRVPDLIRSIDKWGGDFRQRVTGCDIPGLPPGKGATDDELREWIEGHYGACREYFEGRETFLEFDIAEPETRGRLAEFLGVQLPWWGVANAKGQPKLGGPAAAANGDTAGGDAKPEAEAADPGGGDGTRARILAAARELQTGGGYTLAELATGAGVSRSTLYRQFRTREELTSALAEEPAADVAVAEGGDQPAPAAAEDAAFPDASPVTVLDAATTAPGPPPAAPPSPPPPGDRLGRFAADDHSPLARILERVPAHLVPEQLVAEARRVAGTAVALYIVDDRGSELIRLAGADDLPDRIRVPSAFGWELLPEALAGLHASLHRGFPESRLIPLAVRDRVIGVLLTATEPVAPVGDLARQAAAALELADPLTDAIERRRRTHPLSPAAELQRSLLPPPLLRVTGGEIAADVQASPAVGGDWYDVAENEDGAWLALADPPGRGLAAVARSAVALAAYRAARRTRRDLLETVRSVHEALAEAPGEPVPALLARWHAASSTVGWVRCGNVRGFVAGPGGRLTALEGPEHPALGQGGAEIEVHPRIVRLSAGDRLLLVSDGVMNRRVPGGARFGAAGVEAAAAAADPRTAGGTVIAVRRALAAASRKLLADDATVVVLAAR